MLRGDGLTRYVDINMMSHAVATVREIRRAQRRYFIMQTPSRPNLLGALCSLGVECDDKCPKVGSGGSPRETAKTRDERTTSCHLNDPDANGSEFLSSGMM